MAKKNGNKSSTRETSSFGPTPRPAAFTPAPRPETPKAETPRPSPAPAPMMRPSPAAPPPAKPWAGPATMTAPAAASTATATKRGPAVTQEEIAARARTLWEASGRKPGRDEQNWLEAERQLYKERGLK